MAGETTKTAALTNAQAGINRASRLNKGKYVVGTDSHAYSTGELEAADNLITNIELPSNAIVREIRMYNDDLDSNGSPALVFDVGVAAGADYTDITSGSATKHSEDDIIDADLFVDGSTEGQSANTNWVSLTPDSATMGPDDIDKPIWERLGYDEDPRTTFRLSITAATAAATAAAGDMAIECHYLVD